MKRILVVTLCVFLMVSAQAQDELPFEVEPLASFDQPWALAFLPDGRILLTEKKGTLLLIAQDGRSFGCRPEEVRDGDFQRRGQSLEG